MEDCEPGAGDACVGGNGEGEAVMEQGCGCTGEEAGEGAVAGGALPEDAQQNGGKERCVEDGKGQE